MTEALATLAPWLFVGAVALLVGVAFGYYAASADLTAERRAAYRAGLTAGHREAHHAKIAEAYAEGRGALYDFGPDYDGEDVQQ